MATYYNRFDTWTYASANSVTVPGDMSTTYWPGQKIIIVQGTTKFFQITSVVYSAPNTTITLNGFGIYTLTSATITYHADTVFEYPKGFPLIGDQISVHSASSKTTPIDADELELLDSNNSYNVKKLTWANIKATLKTYFDTIYSAVGHTHPNVIPESTSENDVIVSNSAHEWAKKTLSELKTILGLGSAAYTASSDYAPIAKGVTNGDSHDHNGGDGGQIAYANLSGLPTIPTSADLGGGSETVGGSAANGAAATFSRSDHKHAITNPALDTLAACTDITTRNASASAHGLLPKLDNIATHFLNGQGAWATPAGDETSALPFVTVGTSADADYITDGVADNVQIQAAVDTVYALGGGVVQLLLDEYHFASDAGVTVKEHVTIRGVNNPMDGTLTQSYTTAHGSVIMVYSKTVPAFKMYPASTVEDLWVYYPNQNTNAAPVVYPGAFYITADGSVPASDQTIRRVMAANPYIFVDAYRAHYRLIVEDCAGYPLYVGVRTQDSTDIDYIQRNHFNPNYYTGRGETLVAWVMANAYAFYIVDADWPRIQDNFCWGYKYGIYLYEVDDAFVTNNGCDRTSYGINLILSNDNHIQGNVLNIFGASYISPSESFGINVASGDDNIIEGNSIVSAVYGIRSNGSGTIIMGNKLRDINTGENLYSNAIQIMSGGDQNVVVSNHCNGNSRDNTIAIGIESGNSGSVVNSNVMYNYDDYGIFIVSGATNFTAIGNIAIGCGDGICDNSGSVTKEIAHNIEV